MTRPYTSALRSSSFPGLVAVPKISKHFALKVLVPGVPGATGLAHGASVRLLMAMLTVRWRSDK